MSHPITLNWTNLSTDAFSFGQVQVEHGTTPTANPPVLPAGGSSSVTADQSNNLSPGPVGSFNWTSASNGQTIAVQYNHPAGTGQTVVEVQCASAYEVSADQQQWSSQQTYTNASLQQHAAVLSLYLRDAGGAGPPAPPPAGGLVPLDDSMVNKAAFVNSLFTTQVRDAGVNQLDPDIAAGALKYDYADSNSQSLILGGWLAAWQYLAGLPYDPAAAQRCPEQDLQFLQWFVPYIADNQLCLAMPTLSLEPGGASPPIYRSTGYTASPFVSAGTWNQDTVQRFLGLLYYGAHIVVVCASADRNGGNAVANLGSALSASGLPTRHDLYNSHYGLSGGLLGTYYAPQGAPTPSLSQRDVETFASSSPPGQEPLIFSLLTGPTAATDPNYFLQLEGWPAQDVLLPTPGGARHNADYQANISLYWNFATYGACVYSEKRSTPVFLCNSAFNLAIDPSTGMPSYVGATELEDWMNPGLIVQG